MKGTLILCSFKVKNKKYNNKLTIFLETCQNSRSGKKNRHEAVPKETRKTRIIDKSQKKNNDLPTLSRRTEQVPDQT